MLGKKVLSNKITKRRTGILKVFTDTINNLDNLEKETNQQIEAQQAIIDKETQEKQALEQEKAFINKTLGKMRETLGIPEVEHSLN